jgi:hypothetical protein
MFHIEHKSIELSTICLVPALTIVLPVNIISGTTSNEFRFLALVTFSVTFSLRSVLYGVAHTGRTQGHDGGPTAGNRPGNYR